MFISLAVIIIFLFVYMWFEAHRNRVTYTNLIFHEFPKSFGEMSIFFISDIHRRNISKKIINEVKGKADIVIIGGDLTEKGVPFARVAKNIRRLKEIGPIYFVWGNNDYEADFRQLDSFLTEEGVKTLDNTAVIFESEEGEKIALLGVDDMSKNRARLDLALLDAGDEGFRILVSHNPAIVDKIQENQRISLVLSGHTHGGQIRIFSFGIYEKGGVRKTNGTTVVVSNGYGTTALPFRLGAPAETHLITLKSM
ncbi:putative MPP superfamily phosphohydrolase [Anoxybacillus vitaminiphilus]|uniref:Putative MPP superfamily phosphohydrolase n=1 Tax=Paranoxybacillus vitaminiphilus TaxID=581036 RepID=A0A327YNX0_9BACL|nr:metallophosphoesterase [Anoxybacillus vitaminiphilus]RAK22191.1 putative MPP superfamily phosphohydrolase [Anoxybacillus vitaminiphilus]